MKKLVRERLSEQIAREIESMIKSGEYSPGSVLPSERNLAAEFGVSRVMVREAIRILEAKGLVNTKAGQGTFISETAGTSPESTLFGLLLKDSLDKDVVPELLMFRRYLEIALVKLGGKRISEKDLLALEKDLSRFRHGIDNGDVDEIALADESFHQRIAAVAKSKVLARIVRVLWVNLSAYQRLYFENCSSPATILNGLTTVVRCLRDHDIEGAAKAMEKVLEYGDNEFVSCIFNKINRDDKK